jgi:hypothetical protein
MSRCSFYPRGTVLRQPAHACACRASC